MRLLITAFDAFGGETTNPALQVLEALPREIATLRLIRAQLPTAFDQAAPLALDLLRRLKPRFALFLGQAGGRTGITVEARARNLMDAQIPDNQGKQPGKQPIDPEGPDFLPATLCVENLAQAVLAAGIPASVSRDAGAFVCNHLLYSALRYTAVHRLDIPAAFIHLPYLPRQAAGREPTPPSLSLEDQVRGVAAAIAALAG